MSCQKSAAFSHTAWAGTATISHASPRALHASLGGSPSSSRTLSKSNLADTAGINGGTISGLLTLQVVDEANPGAPIYSGSLAGFASGGPISLGSAFAHNEAHTYDFTVTLPHTAGNTQRSARERRATRGTDASARAIRPPR